MFLTPALDFAIVRKGRWRGYLVASIRTQVRAPDGMSYPHYPFFLLTPDGKQVRQVGTNRERIEKVIARIAAQQ